MLMVGQMQVVCDNWTKCSCWDDDICSIFDERSFENETQNEHSTNLHAYDSTIFEPIQNFAILERFEQITGIQ